MIHTFTDSNFDTEVLASEKPVLVDFWATWCGPCRMIAPILDEIAQETEEQFKIGKVNIEENPEITGKCGVRNVPAFLFFKGGVQKDQIIGTTSKAELLAKLNALA